MARAALLHLLRSQSKQLSPRNFHSGYSPCRTGAWSHIPNIKPNLNSFSQLTVAQKRWASQATAREDDNKISIGPRRGREDGEDEKDRGIVYYGPISSTIKKVAVASTVIFLSASTTAALHWFVSPYIHKLRWQPGSDSFEVEMLSWLARHLPRTIKFVDIRPPQTNRPFVTFKANGSFYFVDAEHCHNKALLARLTPQKEVHESASKNL